MEGFLRYKVGGCLYLEGLIFGILQDVQKCPRNRTMNQRKFKFWGKCSKLRHRKALIKTQFYLGDLVTCAGDQEIGVVSGRLPNNPGELASQQSPWFPGSLLSERPWEQG